MQHLVNTHSSLYHQFNQGLQVADHFLTPGHRCYNGDTHCLKAHKGMKQFFFIPLGNGFRNSGAFVPFNRPGDPQPAWSENPDSDNEIVEITILLR